MRKARHPVRTAVRAATPKPVKKVQRAVGTMTHPLEAAEFAVQNQIVRSVRGGARKQEQKRQDGVPARFTDQWIRRTMPRLKPDQVAYVLTVMRERNWTEEDLRQRVYPYIRRS